jgi:hypothetical protein
MSLIVHAGGVRRTRQELATLHTPPPTPTWRPVPHSELISSLIDGLQNQGVGIARDEYATMGNQDAKLFGVMDLRISGLDTADYTMALGLRGANDKSMAIQVIAAARVFVCDNMAFSGSDGSVVLRKRHTSRLDLVSVIPHAIDQFLERAGAFRLDLDRMKNTPLPDWRAKNIIHDAFASRVLPLRLFPTVSQLFFRDEDQYEKFPERNLWNLSNAFTEAVKSLKPAPQHESGQRIGRFFGRQLHRRQPETIAVIDGIEVLSN